jgi:DNA-binding response OmpR family regulator
VTSALIAPARQDGTSESAQKYCGSATKSGPVRGGSASVHHGVVAQQLLVIEDDAPVRSMLRLLLEDEGYEVVEAADGEQGLASFEARCPDLMLVDLRLPGMHGFDVCRVVRQTSDVPIIVLTAQVDSHDVVAGLEAGADDYVTKPFVPKELAARIRAALRRAGASLSGASGAHIFGDVEIRPGEGVVRRSGMLVHVTKTEFRLLCELAEHAGLVLSREQLLERVWGYDYLGDSRLVDAHVRRLRAKLEDDPSHPTLLRTMRGLGYKLTKPYEDRASPV